MTSTKNHKFSPPSCRRGRTPLLVKILIIPFHCVWPAFPVADPLVHLTLGQYLSRSFSFPVHLLRTGDQSDNSFAVYFHIPENDSFTAKS